jgi:hypothetical protein
MKTNWGCTHLGGDAYIEGTGDFFRKASSSVRMLYVRVRVRVVIQPLCRTMKSKLIYLPLLKEVILTLFLRVHYYSAAPTRLANTRDQRPATNQD